MKRMSDKNDLKSTAEQVDKIDLFNFDSPVNMASRYILTSPRSLKACSRLGIKPVELLPQSSEEFSASAPATLSQGQEGASALEAVYEEWEKQRRRKLQAARREREKIIAELEGHGSAVSRDHSSGGGANVEIVTVQARLKKRKGGPHPVKDSSIVKDKDQRLLDVMESRYAGEERDSLLQSAVQLQWDIQRKKEELDREQRQLAHQRELTRSQKHFKSQMSQLKSLQDSLREGEKLRLLSSLEAKWNRWSSSAQLLATAKYQQLEEKRFQEERKKQSQERRLEELETEGREVREASARYWREMEHRAEENRALIVNSASMERQLRRRATESRHRTKMEELEVELREQKDALRTYLAERDSLAQQCYLTHKKHREAVIKQASESRSERADRARQVTEELESELRERGRELEDHLRQSMTQAEQVTQWLLEERRRRAHTDRTRREQIHSERLGQVREEERERKLQYAEEIESKTKRSESIKKERQSFVEKSRQAAYTSATQRRKVKDKYLRNSFDKMALEAELLASLERKHSQCRKANSRTVLG